MESHHGSHSYCSFVRLLWDIRCEALDRETIGISFIILQQFSVGTDHSSRCTAGGCRSQTAKHPMKEEDFLVREHGYI